MRRRLAEGTVLFFSVLKWFLLSTVAGILVGLSTTLFLKILQWSTSWSQQYSLYFLFLPLAMVVSVVLTKYIAPEAEGHGTEKVIEAVHRRAGKIKPLVVPVKLAATIVTLAAGGSVGKEGPCAQIGSGVTSAFADLLKFDDQDRKRLVICGISAGFATVFGTPIGGAIFGVEVLFIGNIMYDVLLPSFIAGITSYQVSSAFGIIYTHQPIQLVPVFSESFLLIVALSGVFFGIVSAILVETMKLGEKLSSRLHVADELKGVIGGVIVVALGLILSQRYLGLGLSTIEETLSGQKVEWYAFLVKAVCTSTTLNAGGSGGIITPIFFVGATAGSLFAEILRLDTATFAAIGMVSLVAGAANTPIAASIMSVEMFGPRIAPYAAVACVISFLMSGHRSVYPSQVLAVRKSGSLEVELGREIEDVRATAPTSPGAALGRIFRSTRVFGRRRHRDGSGGN